MRSKWVVILMGVAILPLFLIPSGSAQQQGEAKQAAKDSGADWPMYHRDFAGTGYSPLKQITEQNVASLTPAWTYRLQSDAPPPVATKGKGRGPGGANSEATPIVVNGVMYLPAAGRVVALDPETGKEIWDYPVTGGAPSRRGVAYWPGDTNNPPRIVFTIGRRLVALNANTGKIDPGFGKEGEVDMVVPYNSVALVYHNVLVVGANTTPGPVSIGNARAFDARTGAKLWEFSSVAQPGDPGHDTWEGDSWKNRSGANAWPFYFTVDDQRGLVYLPLASPIPGFYGGDRKGANLYGNSVVAVDVQTGKLKWYFQTIHHDIWDHDPPAPPGLFDIEQNGRTIPALALTTKSGYMYILNRETGQPVFGVEERRVPKSDVPGEQAFPTQPFPTKPPPIARNSFTTADLVTAADTTEDHAKACQELVAKNGGVSNAGPFTTWPYRAEGAPVKSAVVFPGGLGGSNWGGVAWDPNSKYVFVVSQDDGALGFVTKTRDGYDKTTLDGAGPGRGNFDVRMGNEAWPCQKPPWGRLTAVNTATGDFAWQIPLGITEGLPAGKQNTGRPALAGPIVTASGLLFVASTDDNYFRAFEAKTGKQLWATKLARRGNANPMTYQGRNGKQYVAIVATDTLDVFALP